jgi:hypothetical protein
MSVQKAVVVSEKLGVTVDPLAVVQTLIEYGDKWVVEVQRAKAERAGIAAWEHTQVERITHPARGSAEGTRADL